jgi:hypothetical protein
MAETVLIQYDHITLQNRWPDTEREVSQVPRIGESVSLFGRTYVVHDVHWWDNPEPGRPAARVVLRIARRPRDA